MEPRKFSVGNREYELRVWREDNSTFVQCFENDLPATLRFSVYDDTKTDLLNHQAKSAVEQLVRIAVGDLINANRNQ